MGKRNISIAILLFFIIISKSFAWLEDDKSEILSQFNYIEEDASQPILRALYEKSLELYAVNDFKEASFYFRKIMDINKNYKQTEFLSEAIEKMQNYPIYDAKNIVIEEYYEKGRKFYENADYLKALHIWERVLVLNPSQTALIQASISDARHLLAEPHYVKGWEYYRKEQYDQAIEEWEAVLALVPTYHGLASLLEKTVDKSKYSKLNNTVEEARDLYNKEKLKTALKKVETALRIDASYQPAINLKKSIEVRMDNLYYNNFNTGLELYRDSKYPSSIKSFEKALDYAPDKKRISEVQDYIRKAQHQIALSKGKKVPEIKEEITPVIEEPVVTRQIDEEEVRNHYNQGLYYYKNGYLEKAISEWEAVLNLDPAHERAYTNLQKAKKALSNK
ncbi:MAG: tetratricopeptide repeat protein [Elusimicrobiota bacterium]